MNRRGNITGGFKSVHDGLGVCDGHTKNNDVRIRSVFLSRLDTAANVFLAAHHSGQITDIVIPGQRAYSASKPPEIDSLANPDDKAAKLARELIGDYGNISAAGQYIRRRLIPFYSWMEINMPRYVYLMRNLRSEDRHSDAAKVRRRMAGIVSAKVAKGGALLALKANLLMGAVLLWNMLLHKDEWEELGEAKRRQVHLIIGRTDDGTIQSIRFQGALSDALSFFGLEDWPADIVDISKGKATIQDKIIEAPKALATKAIEGIRPEPKNAV